MKVTSDWIVAAWVLWTWALLAHNYAPWIVWKTIDTTLWAASGIFAGVKVWVESVLNTPEHLLPLLSLFYEEYTDTKRAFEMHFK